MVASEQEEFILQLLDSYWFEHEIFKPKSKPTIQKPSQCKIHRPSSLIVRSFSEEHLSSNYENINSDRTEPSPKSVLVVPKLQSIVSGKEVQEFGDNKEKNNEEREKRIVRRRRRQRGNSKSLSELEFEELKGFMDLGFVFDNNEVKNSSLVSILPGLQRMGGENESYNEVAVSRPYLSEAWDVLEDKQKRMKWRIPHYGNEMELKDHLKVWAHNVASTVR